MKHRALVVVLTDNPGGAERIACSVANCLAEDPDWGVDFRVVCSSSAGFLAANLSPAVNLKMGKFRRERWAFPFAALSFVGSKYDLIFTTHVHTNAIMSLLRRLKCLHVKKLVARETTTIFDRFSGLKKGVFRFLYRLYGKHDLLIAQTSYMADHIRSHIPPAARRHLVVMPNPVSPQFSSSAMPDLDPSLSARLGRRDNILFCGRLIDVKQPLLALAAYASVVTTLGKENSPRLVYLGDGYLGDELKSRAQALGFDQDDVVFLGTQSHPVPIMRMCQYGLITSSREGFPNVLLEMMASGFRKIVMTPCAGDLNNLTGISVVNGFDADLLAKEMISSIKEGEDRSRDYFNMVNSRSIDRYVDNIINS